ncbi:SDR family oxidoreductase [Microbacterium candidum]|uniref:SDR family oxidoreductase n=1 Tax=Microbacterium candidum TaxID=3041922 RepID=A0ABT7MTZ4_9MICO|nr:SDR family oxidoreductase [Microbacterium sp. ASV49]MDL9977914.1 SDR family oxidoreductase [Microbacterium sp. ASV49]
MRIFVTGGTGLIGSAVVAELIEHGHDVIVLTRSDASADVVRAAGAEPVRGDLADLDVLRAVAGGADGVIHLAFDNDFTTPEAIVRAIAQEAAAVDAMAGALRGGDRPLVTVAGTPAVPGRASTEDDPQLASGPVAGRAVTVQSVLDLDGVRGIAVRMPRTVHNNGTGGFAGLLTQMARRSGVVGYPGDGAQRWPAVHALDAAAVFRLALEFAPPGTAWHAVDDEGVAVRDMAEVIGRRLGLPVRSLPEESFGPLGVAFATDQPSTSIITREALGWEPTHPSLLEDLENLQP